jgi:hypothetical protein
MAVELPREAASKMLASTTNRETVTGEAGEYRDRLVEFVIRQGIELEFKESIAPAMGVSYGARVALLLGQSPAEEFSTLVHELAHEMLHKADRCTATRKTVRETEAEAEAIAFVVGKTIGRLHPALPRQRPPPHRELGSDPEDLRPQYLRPREHGNGNSRRTRTRTGASQLTAALTRRTVPRRPQLPIRMTNPLKGEHR